MYAVGPHRTAASIWGELKATFPEDRDKYPTPRAVQVWLGDFEAERADRWSLDDDQTPAEAAAVLRVTRALLEEGRPQPTRQLARWIARIGTAFPDLVEADPSLVYVCAARADAGFTERVEMLLAFRPWADGGAALAEAVARGRVPFQVAFDAGLEREVAMAKLRLLSEKGKADHA